MLYLLLLITLGIELIQVATCQKAANIMSQNKKAQMQKGAKQKFIFKNKKNIDTLLK